MLATVTIGFEQQKEYFKQLLSQGSLSHAYLFTGPEAIGKKQFALDLYEQLQGHAPNALDTDFRLIAPRRADDETKIYIEDIRDLKEFMAIKPTIGKYRFVLIDEADRLTEEASNALLKTLEEPHPFSVLILITVRERFLLTTITSRCQKIAFKAHAPEVVSTALASYKIPKEDQALLVSLADGRIGWTSAIAQNPEKLQAVQKNLKDFQGVLRKGAVEKIKLAKVIADQDEPAEIVDLWIRFSRLHGKDPQKTARVLHQLLDLYALISQPQFNHRLAVENFLLGI